VLGLTVAQIAQNVLQMHNKTVGASQPQGADDVENVRGRNTTVRLYQEEVWEGTCNCLGPECVG